MNTDVSKIGGFLFKRMAHTFKHILAYACIIKKLQVHTISIITKTYWMKHKFIPHLHLIPNCPIKQYKNISTLFTYINISSEKKTEISNNSILM